MQKNVQGFPQNLTADFLASASGWYNRAVTNLMSQLKNTDLGDVETCRVLNDRIMTVRPSESLVYLRPVFVLTFLRTDSKACASIALVVLSRSRRTSCRPTCPLVTSPSATSWWARGRTPSRVCPATWPPWSRGAPTGTPTRSAPSLLSRPRPFRAVPTR